MKRTKIIDALKRTDYGAEINVKGWVRSKRGSKGIFFIALNDGSTIKNVQIVGDDARFDEETLKRLRSGQYGGIGSIINYYDDNVHISEPYENFPAHKAGLLPGDAIIEINGVNTEKKTDSEVSELLKGQPGSKLTLKIRRDGEKDVLNIDDSIISVKFDKSLVENEIKMEDIRFDIDTNLPEDVFSYCALEKPCVL